MFIQGFLATMLFTGKDCIPYSAATEVPPGVLYRVFRPVCKLIGVCALLLAQAGDLCAGEQIEGGIYEAPPSTCAPLALWGHLQIEGLGRTVLSEQKLQR